MLLPVAFGIDFDPVLDLVEIFLFLANFWSYYTLKNVAVIVKSAWTLTLKLGRYFYVLICFCDSKDVWLWSRHIPLHLYSAWSKIPE